MNPDYEEMLFALYAENVEFLVVGAYATAAHGAPRSTGDIDFWVKPSNENADRVWRALLRFGAPLSKMSPSDFSGPNVIFQMGVQPIRIDIITSIDGVAWDEAWSTHEVHVFEGAKMPVLSRELLLRNKRAVDRPKDREDILRLERRAEKREAAKAKARKPRKKK